MRSLPSPVYKRGNGKSFQMSQYPIHDREQGLAPMRGSSKNVPLGLQKTCIDRLGRRINLFVPWLSSD
jgi:hypothetical protein